MRFERRHGVVAITTILRRPCVPLDITGACSSRYDTPLCTANMFALRAAPADDKHPTMRPGQKCCARHVCYHNFVITTCVTRSRIRLHNEHGWQASMPPQHASLCLRTTVCPSTSAERVTSHPICNCAIIIVLVIHSADLTSSLVSDEQSRMVLQLAGVHKNRNSKRGICSGRTLSCRQLNPLRYLCLISNTFPQRRSVLASKPAAASASYHGKPP